MIYTFFSSVFIALFIVVGTIALYGYLDLSPEDVTEILKESL